MKYKEFGIYVEEGVITILVDMRPNEALGIDYFLGDYYKTRENISNKEVNEWLFANFDKILEEQVFKVDLKEYPYILYNSGYLGKVEDVDLQTKMKELARVVWTDIDWSM